MKRFIYAMTTVSVILTAISSVACNTDEYDEEDESKNESKIHNTALCPHLYYKDGTPFLIQQVGQMKFKFDGNGKLTEYIKDGIQYILQPSTLQYIAEGEDNDTIITNIETNTNGLISKIWQHYRYEYGSYYLPGLITGDKLMEFNYNHDLQMTDVSFTNTYYYLTEENENDSNKTLYKSTGNIILTWEDDNLTQCEQQLNIPASDGYHAQRTLTFEYEDEENILRLFPYTIGTVVFTNIGEEQFCPLGLFGNGPKTLPTKCHEKYTEEYNDEINTGADIYTYFFELNNNGTLKRESANKHKYTYKYITE